MEKTRDGKKKMQEKVVEFSSEVVKLFCVFPVEEVLSLSRSFTFQNNAHYN